MKKIKKQTKKVKESADEQYLKEWTEICEAFCKKIGAKLLFVNLDNFGYEDKDGNLVHMYADELEQYLKNASFKESQSLKEEVLSEPVKDLINQALELIDSMDKTISYDLGSDASSLNSRIETINEKTTLGIDELDLDNLRSDLQSIKEDLEYALRNSEWSEEEALEDSEKLKEATYEQETDPEKRLYNVYLMDRVLRAFNNEDALYDGWLSVGVADGDTDDGFEAFKDYSRHLSSDEYYYVSDEEYKDLIKLYKYLVKKYGKDGILTRDYFKNTRGNWQPGSGATPEEVKFVQEDLPNITLINESASDNKCSICGKVISGWGNNAEPVNDGYCCDKCNSEIVVPYRIYLSLGGSKLDSIDQIKKMSSLISTKL